MGETVKKLDLVLIDRAMISLVLFSHSVMSDSCDPMDHSMPGFPVLHYLPEFAQTHVHWGFLGNLAAMRENWVRLQFERPGFNPWAGKIPWRRAWQPTPVFMPGKSHGQKNLVGYSP